MELHLIVYKNFTFIIKPSGYAKCSPMSRDIVIQYKSNSTEAETLIREIIADFEGELFIPATDENFNDFVELYNKGYFSCVEVNDDVEGGNLDWLANSLEEEVMDRSKSSDLEIIDLTFKFINI